ncbi:bifunctional demethylmenaquinone methyltransferase/2-methoxy-6-polyprenyl-1,4-benzoquinol methylase UbiE [Blochmannia endosymbiont of Camponotus sp. C-003]|uniref:bifunctional demethylmenaquinone methyltransferase/2-methoxy-6-polyprenyl-1,4-benzoquinol methylase UbiE n=1 Tax=unclassified Candidatus Blochmanniella TaxID=711328 RepID=UPI00202550D0|nr:MULTISPECIES: bifunctional demethylmenaquinone methyltransferase/2-methoxy-6-polyprenyl-1,4-benzoquinol methylase UbiE [unclassified Candidatus Blochmannia]URJ23233.1 bifunctional demethylmenaquinone methyltransferase/2-methoxy-6-polyprenyl-1,4-benzoquinol methylase UbiE [Blochmannia endosymbiont of Camponotus sp. C-003]URJ28702.1 bifunctional demethylmenaquinone methyltransferase/2-methoxy-6-polyprenyl-1,4-benzoquinol methylase UbiE [Blochmannia endosymbiont of Camponotus sp. C-046]
MNNKYEKDITHFGFKNVYKNKKASLVSNIFHTVASQYDLMNDLMSFGIHRIWKQFVIYHSEVYVGCNVLDLAGGTGDLSIPFSRLVGNTGIVVLADINSSMLHIGQKKLRNLGILNNVLYIQADAESLPFSENTFDCVAVSFGLRNFTNKEQALFSIHRVLKPKGKLLILDFGVPVFKILNKIYDLYSFHILPKIGECVTQDINSYRYLVESIRMHPDQETLKNMIIKAGFKNVEYFNMTFGIAVLHYAYKC